MDGDLGTRASGITWFHSIDLGTGIVTQGACQGYVPQHALPDVRGRSVLDIGAWDGYYSFLAEELGAARVVALDHYVWGLDFAARDRYWAECRADGTLPDHARDTTEFWRPDLPGRRGFDLARKARGSAVEPVLADFMATDLGALGVFDVVFYFGVLYHMKEPLTALERLRTVTGTVAVIETEALHVPAMPDAGLLTFVHSDSVGADFGNWYVPSSQALRSLCLAAGFTRVEIVVGPPASGDRPATLASRVRRRLADGTGPAPALRHYRVVARAYV